MVQTRYIVGIPEKFHWKQDMNPQNSGWCDHDKFGIKEIYDSHFRQFVAKQTILYDWHIEICIIN